MKPDFDKMTLDELRDWLAREGGWTQEEAQACVSVNVCGIHPATGKYWKKGGRMTWEHPCAHTLDAADAAMPDGWEWMRYVVPHDGMSWVATRGLIWEKQCTPDTGNKVRDLFALACKCRWAEREAQQ